MVLGALLLTGLIGLVAMPTTAQADILIAINPGNVPTTAEDFDPNSCDNIPGGASPTQDGWVFVLPGNDSEFVSLTLTFQKPDLSLVVLTIPTDGGGIIGGPGTSKAYLQTDPGWTLTAGTAQITGDSPPPSGNFNLTHTCPTTGGPTPSPSPTPSMSASPSPSQSPSPSLSASPSSSPSPSPSMSPSPSLSPSPSASPSPSSSPSGSASPSPSPSASTSASPSAGPSATPTAPVPSVNASTPPPPPSGLPVTGAGVIAMVSVAAALIATGLALRTVSRRRPGSGMTD